jgi:hypothetical protein
MESIRNEGRQGIESNNCEVVKFGIQLKTKNREAIINMFRKLLNDRFLRIDYDFGYRRGFQLDKLIYKINKRYKKEFREATFRILTNLGCTNLKLEENKHNKYNDIFICDTPFGPRRIFVLGFGFDGGYQEKYELAVIGFRLIETKCCSVLNFRTDEGGLHSVNEEDFTKHYDMIEKELLVVSPEFKAFQFLFAKTYI